MMQTRRCCLQNTAIACVYRYTQRSQIMSHAKDHTKESSQHSGYSKESSQHDKGYIWICIHICVNNFILF